MPVKTLFLSDHVQDVSCRNFIIAQMLQAGFDRGSAVNVSKPEAGVEIKIGGDERRIREFIPKLKSELKSEFGNGLRLEEAGGADSGEPPDIMRTSQAHLMLQFRKATDILQKEFGGVQAGLGSVREELGGVREELGGVRKELGSVREELGSIHEQLEKLPGAIAEAIAKKENNRN